MSYYRVPLVLFIVGTMIAAFAVFMATRHQICEGTWSQHHTVLTLEHCRIQW